MEKWKWVVGYENKYKVSNAGRVRDTSQHTMKLRKTRKGYLITDLTGQPNARTTYSVHRLVLEAFVGPCPDGMETAHLDGSKDNNNINNLRWVTRKENESHKILHGTVACGERHGMAKLSLGDVRQIRQRLLEGLSQPEIAKHYGVTSQAISQINTGKTWASQEGGA